MAFLDAQRIHKVLEELKDQFDFVLLDCAELKTYQDGYFLSSICDKIILVVCENSTRRQVVGRVASRLKEHNTSIEGVILNNRTYPVPKFVYENV